MHRLAVLTFGLITCVSLSAADRKIPDVVKFNRDIRPVLSDNCLRCHGPDEKHREADLRLDVEESAKEDRDGSTVIKAGDLSASTLWERITSDDEDLMMPPPHSKKVLSAHDRALLKKWIEQGAKFEGHWAFISPELPTIPAQVPNAIDYFVRKRLAEESMKMAPLASREELLRRVTFDLTGLPPTLKEIDDFINDKSPNAYEKVVDRLLASEKYGERMTLAWMDIARYGDSSVYHADGPRDMWAWRDWVIRAYNSNMPFDQFTVEQLAGDLIPNATVWQKVASGFHRNHGTTDEGGAIAEEYRVEYVVDRVKTTSTVWMGLTMECAQCHEHKYDPITQEEYYKFYAFFNNNTDSGMQTRRGNAAPTVSVPNMGAESRIQALEEQIAGLNKQLDVRKQKVEGQFQDWLNEKFLEASTNEKKTELPGNTLVHFSFEEGKGKMVTDSSGGKTVGNFKGNIPFADAKFGKGLKIAPNNFVDCGQVANFERTDQFSYGAWIYAESDGAPLAKMQDGNAYRGWDLYLAGGSVGMHFINAWQGNALKVMTKKKFPKKKWMHVFITHDGTGKAAGVKVYVDGVHEPHNIEVDKLTGTTKSTVPLYIGRRNPGSQWRGTIDDVRIYNRQLSPEEVALLAGNDPIAPLLAKSPEDRTKEETETLRNYYVTTVDKDYAKITADIAKVQAGIGTLKKPLTTVMILSDNANPRMTYILERGHYASPKKDKVIEPGTPSALPAPPSKEGRATRLDLAKWLTDPNHPLTARVAVNRYWQMFFGEGIVETVEDFGSQGAWPSHPELLDWLAVDFATSGWNVKRMFKQIVMSDTYRQTARVPRQQYKSDPKNRLLARGPRFRLQGEFIRDSALAVSGLLVPTVGGPGVKPYQPPNIWNEVSLNGGPRYKQDTGDKLYRRSMYIYWKRSAPSPSMQIFDAPTREKCVIRRAVTNTPLQALVTLNDIQFVEASRMLAERMMKDGGESLSDRIAYGYRLSTSRYPRAETVELLMSVYNEERAIFEKEPERATKLLATGERPRDDKLNATEHAAWTIVASMILNLDASLTR